MPVLDDGDWFRSCQFDDHDGVNAVFTLSEDRVRQYAFERDQRSQKARQKIQGLEAQKIRPTKARLDLDQNKEKQEVRDKEAVDATISTDLADGQTALLDASLKLLAQDDIVLFLPSDELEDDEIHIIETTIDPSASNNALQDYQMQLMLLEQQRKKRLMLARNAALAKDDQVNALATARERGRQMATDSKRKPHFEPAMEQKKSRDSSAALAISSTQAICAVEGVAPASKKRKRGRDLKSQSQSSVDASTLDGGDKMLGEARPTHIDLIYRISCHDDSQGSHPAPAFRDAPFPTSTTQPQGRSHLNGATPVFDLEAFMDNDTDDIAFVVVRTVECSEASFMVASTGGHLRWTEELYMKSKVSKIALQQIATCYFHNLYKEPDTSIFMSPKDKTPRFEQNQIVPADSFLFHHRQQLRTYASEHSAAKKHIGALLEYANNRFGVEFAKADRLFSDGLVNQEHLFYLFRPNDLIIGGTSGKPAAFVLQEWPKFDRDGWVTLCCWSLQTDGTAFVRKQSLIMIPPLGPKTVKIESLTAFPLRFAPAELRNSIRQRGEKQWELRNATQVSYSGWNVGRDQLFSDARFMIDHQVYHKMHAFAKAFSFDRPGTTYPFDRMPPYVNVEQEPSDTILLLMQPDIHGFYLNEKKWIKIFVDCIQPVCWNKKAYERLVLPKETKELVRALVTVRTSQKGIKQGLGVAGKRTDITGGKGNGLIMLLHGGPGTGKTLTAESVAELAEMPLYRVTCGDIGTSAEAVEKYLNTVLHLGKTWNCVLLLDEADVFLEERSMADLKRNSLVSVFLRILEYYDGILILTSNRVGMFDEAFKSRIQVALHYENLNRSARKKIWQNFLDMLEEDEENVNFQEIKFHLDDLAGRELNGRQIRNVLTTARQLALFRGESLDWKHLEQALAVASDFNDYLNRMQGHTDDQRARDVGLR